MRDSGLVCASCRAEAEDAEEYEETNLLQSISELQSHIVTRHTDLVTHRSFVLVQNTAAGPQRHTFTYYLCTQCGKCFSRASPLEKLLHHTSHECRTTNNNLEEEDGDVEGELEVDIEEEAEEIVITSGDQIKTDLIASIKNNNENLAKLLTEISPSVTIIARPASLSQPPPLSLMKNKKRDPCPCDFCTDPRFVELKLHKCYAESSCDKTFSKVAHLKAHIRSHKNERPYECEWRGCGKTFVRSDELRRHAWIHTKEDR